MEEELTGKQIDLPPEVMHEILSRLPVKPLCRFKLVSKPWLSLISNPKFIAMHSEAIENNKDVFSQRRRLVFTDGENHCLYSLDLDQFLDHNHAVLKNRKPNEDVDGPVAVATELDFVYNLFPLGRRRWFPFIHSCNSLLLSESFYGYHLINPVAKELKKLPKTPTWRVKPGFGDLYGFGYDYSTKEYKVVIGQFFYGHGTVFSVYTLETDSWRRIKGLPCIPTPDLSRDGIVVNGGVHWLLRRVADESMLMILSFTLAEDKFRIIPLPSSIGSTGSIKLGVFRDWLCITFSSASTEVKTYNEFWVMKEYGVRESWTRMRVSIPYHTLSHSGFWRGSYDLMVFDRSSLVMYNFNDEEFWTLPIKDIGKVGRFGSVGIYVESLASVITQDRV
ncbi:PREDICTED: F-box/kelch-repeat protein At3g06240-like [Fragaria vesca subsp. vesca]|uniref:F-box/kelch-repeat protein At3g06240-like n=1 Tax=Fragaria vesca subsp. vesca TaxID=101020 RepID=UPI0002C35B15|nr:PREDICTED: F-box/kelch-repeat protein At3g06240-like [Fragaria vesca subsp. vesca]